MGILFVLFGLQTFAAEPPRAPNPCEWLMGAQHLELNLANWTWHIPRIQLSPSGHVSYRNGLETPQGLSWVRSSGAVRGDERYDEQIGSASVFFEADLRDGRPTQIRARDTGDTSSAFFNSTPFLWAHLKEGVVPTNDNPEGLPIQRLDRSSWTYWAGRLDFAYEADVIVIRQFALGPPKNQQFGRASEKEDFQPIQDLRLTRSKEGLEAIFSNEYALAGLFQFAAFSSPLLDAFRRPERFLAEAQRRWMTIRDQVKGAFVISKFHVPTQIESGKAFLTEMTYSQARVIRRDHFLNTINPDGDHGGHTFTFEVREMIIDDTEGTLKVSSERTDVAVLYVDAKDGQTTVRRVETRTPFPGEQRAGYPKHPSFPSSLSFYFSNTKDALPAIRPSPPIIQYAYGTPFDRWFQQAVLLEAINTHGRNAIPTLDFMAP